MLTICVDCKEMVLQVVRAQGTARRLRMAKSLFVGADGSCTAASDCDHENQCTMTENADVWGEDFY